MAKFAKYCEHCKHVQSTKPIAQHWQCEHPDRSWNWCDLERRHSSTCGPKGNLWETEDKQIQEMYMASLPFYKKLVFPKVKLKWQ